VRMSKKNQHARRLPAIAGGLICTAVLASCGKLPASVTPTTPTTTPSTTATPTLLSLPKHPVTVLVNNAEVPRLNKLLEQAHIPTSLLTLDIATYKQFLERELTNPAQLAVTNWGPPSTLTSQMALDQITPIGTSLVAFDVNLPNVSNIELTPTLVLDIYTHALPTWNALPLRTLNRSLSTQTEPIQTAVPRNTSFLFAALNNYITSVGALPPNTRPTTCSTTVGCISITATPTPAQAAELSDLNGNFSPLPRSLNTKSSYPLRGSEIEMISAEPRALNAELAAIAIAERLSISDGLPKEIVYTNALSALANHLEQEKSIGS
jgi:hypothetical protein